MDSWLQVASIGGVSRKGVSSFIVNYKAYVCNGIDSSNTRLNELWEYAPVTGLNSYSNNLNITIFIDNENHELIISAKNEIKRNITINLFCLDGRCINKFFIKHFSKVFIPISSYESGTYLLEIENNLGERLMQKIILLN